MSNTIFPQKESQVIYNQASRGSGKTTTLVNLMMTPAEDGGYAGFYDEVYLFSPNVYIDVKLKYLASKMNKSRVFDCFDLDKFNSIINTADGSKRILIILDDCMSEAGFKTTQASNPITKACTIGRNRKISLFVIAQSYVAIPRDARKNLDCYIGFGGMSESELKDLYHGELCLPWYRYKDFVRDYTKYTRDRYSFIVYNKDDREVYAWNPKAQSYKLIADRDSLIKAAGIEDDNENLSNLSNTQKKDQSPVEGVEGGDEDDADDESEDEISLSDNDD